MPCAKIEEYFSSVSAFSQYKNRKLVGIMTNLSNATYEGENCRKLWKCGQNGMIL